MDFVNFDAPPVGKPDAVLVEKLRSLRHDLARREGLQEGMIFSNVTLEEVAAIRPTTRDALLAIKGIGPAKLKRYGPDIFRVMRRYAGTSGKRENLQPLPRSDAVPGDDLELATDNGTDGFFVYILLMEGGEYYIGQTNDILARLHEHRNKMVHSTRERNPKLQWFTTVRTRQEAIGLEQNLQLLNSNAHSRRQITRLVVKFRQLTKELDYEPHQPIDESTVREDRSRHGSVAPPSTRRR